MQESKSKRARAANWDVAERSLFMELLERHVSIINDKSCTANSNALKKQAWASMLSSFNTMSEKKRTLQQLQVQFKTMKVSARKRLGWARREARSTGGGPPPPPPTDDDMKLQEMIPEEFVVERNEFDSDGLFEVGNNADVALDVASDDIFATVDEDLKAVSCVIEYDDRTQSNETTVAVIEQTAATEFGRSQRSASRDIWPAGTPLRSRVGVGCVRSLHRESIDWDAIEQAPLSQPLTPHPISEGAMRGRDHCIPAAPSTVNVPLAQPRLARDRLAPTPSTVNKRTEHRKKTPSDKILEKTLENMNADRAEKALLFQDAVLQAKEFHDTRMKQLKEIHAKTLYYMKVEHEKKLKDLK